MSFKNHLAKIIPANLSKLQKQNNLIKAQKKELDNLKEQLADLEAQQSELEKQNTEMQSKQTNLEEQLTALTVRLNQTDSKLNISYSYVTDKKIMEQHDYLKCMPEKLYTQELADWFYKRTGEHLELKNPQSFNQKIQWLKIYDTTPLKTQLTDKYLVRDWIAERIGSQYLTKLLGVWDDFDKIDFDTLPDKFVLKANHACKMNIIVTDKSTFNKSEARLKFHQWFKVNYAFRGFEPQYKTIKPLIIAEEYLENNNENLYDYKIWCFNGKPEFIQFMSERYRGGVKTATFDTDWNLMPFIVTFGEIDKQVEKPDNLDEMLDIAKKLSEDFCYVRVDLYRLNDGSLKFGEMTFTPGSGACKWNPPEYNKIIGDLIQLPDRQ